MATLKCKVCGTGIHYNSEPSGIEYIFIKKEDWMLICDSRFSAEKKEMDEQGVYPKLYRTDTMEEDFSDMIVKCWRCPECDTVYVFDDKGNVTDVYQKDEAAVEEIILNEGVLFDDYTWDRITELAVPNIALKNEKPTFYVRVFRDLIAISKDDFFADYYCVYKRIK